MSNSGNKTINIKEATRKIEVDHRIPLQHYYKIAHNLLNQADVYRQENNIMDFYILLLRYARLVTETIPFHREYTTSNHREKAYYRKKLLDVIRELERLKPQVEREISKANREHALKELFRHASSSRQPPSLSRMASLWPDNKRMERLCRTIIIGPVTTPEAVVVPSAPPIETLVIDDDASLQSGPTESSFGDSTTEKLSKKRHDEGGSSSSAASSCIICYEASIEGACVPCGHMAGCMSCLNEIKSNNFGCPICRTKIDLVLRLYSV